MSWTAEQNREYQRKWREKNREKINAQERARYGADPLAARTRARERTAAWRLRHPERAKEVRDKAREWKRAEVFKLKAEIGCKTCGIHDARVLDFHHRDPAVKDQAVSQLIARRSWQSVLDEIDKCEVLCANCHRISHYEETAREAAA